jgi:hypothetical protein
MSGLYAELHHFWKMENLYACWSHHDGATYEPSVYCTAIYYLFSPVVLFDAIKMAADRTGEGERDGGSLVWEDDCLVGKMLSFL